MPWSEEQQAQLRELLDERQIHQLLMRYCRGVDRCDLALIQACYAEDAEDDHGSWRQSGARIAEEIVRRVQPGSARAMHFVGNVLIEVQGDQAWSESYLLAFRATSQQEVHSLRTRAVRFVDRLVRGAQGWKIQQRLVVDEWSQVEAEIQAMPEAQQFHFSSKDRCDPVYRMRQGDLFASMAERGRVDV